MKTLLLTDIPPCINFTAGLATAAMCRSFDPGSLVIFSITNVDICPEPFPDLKHLPMEFYAKPNEFGNSDFLGRELGALGSFLNEAVTRRRRIPKLIAAAIDFAEFHEVTQVWAVLQGQTMVQVARPVSKALRVPLKTLIWDPLSWWHRAHKVDQLHRILDVRDWKRAVRASSLVIAPSWTMADEIEKRFNVPSVAIISALPRAAAQPTAEGFRSEGQIRIAMAGQFYASDAWGALCAALESAGWVLNNRAVILHVFGGAPPPNSIPADHIKYHGWVEQTELVELISKECDIFYCPYPFSDEMAEVARFSFPSKVVIGLASARLIFFHGPNWSSPQSYLQKKNAAFLCNSIEPVDVYRALLAAVVDWTKHVGTAASGREAFLEDFTIEGQREKVRTAFAIEPASSLGRPTGASRSRRGTSLNGEGDNAFLESDRAGPVARFFDPWHYWHSHPMARSFSRGILSHYLKHGWRVGADPTNWFSVSYYLENNPDLNNGEIEPFGHYLSIGWREGRSPNHWFSVKRYLSENPDVAKDNVEPVTHYLQHGWREGREPNWWFSAKHYTKLNQSVLGHAQEPLAHYLSEGWRQFRDPNYWFSIHYYLTNNPEVADGIIDPLTHYFNGGWKEGRNPNSWFSTDFYLSNNPDVADAGHEPLSHYLLYGWKEGRDPNTWFSVKGYLSEHPELIAAGEEPMRHYLENLSVVEASVGPVQEEANVALRQMSAEISRVSSDDGSDALFVLAFAERFLAQNVRLIKEAADEDLDGPLAASLFDLLKELSLLADNWLRAALPLRLQ